MEKEITDSYDSKRAVIWLKSISRRAQSFPELQPPFNKPVPTETEKLDRARKAKRS